MATELFAGLVGFAMGFLGSVPLTGPIALLVFHRSLQKRYLRAMAVGVGGALGEVIYCALAVAGVGEMVEKFPLASAGLKFVSAMILVAFGLYFLVAPPGGAGTGEEAPEEASKTWVKDLAQGFSISAFNPILLLNWTGAVALVYGLLGWKLEVAGQVMFVTGATVGVATWFCMMVLIVKRFQAKLPEGTVTWIQRGMGAIVLVAAAFLLPVHDILTALA